MIVPSMERDDETHTMRDCPPRFALLVAPLEGKLILDATALVIHNFFVFRCEGIMSFFPSLRNVYVTPVVHDTVKPQNDICMLLEVVWE